MAREFNRVRSQIGAAPGKLGLGRRESKTPTPIQVDALLNRPSIIGGQTIGSLTDATRLPDVPIPDGFSVVIRGLQANTSAVRIAGIRADALTTNKNYPIQPGEIVRYFIQNLSAVWIGISTGGDGVAWTVEQDAQVSLQA